MFVKRPDSRLLSLSFGQGAQTMLALGGWVGSGEVRNEVIGYLPHWRCVTYDHRGSGASSHNGPITLAAMVDDPFAVMDAQRIDRCILAAESAGAGVALEAVLRAPERFTGLVLCGGAWKRPLPGQYDAFIGRLRKDFDAELLAFAAGCVPEPNGEDVRHWGYQILRRASLKSAIELLECRSALTVQDRLTKVRVPTLLVHGTKDYISPLADSQELAKALPDAELELMPDLGHVPILTAPAEVARLIERRFDCVSVRAPSCKP